MVSSRIIAVVVVRLCLLFTLGIATNASSQTPPCNCAKASLVGDTVGTRFNLGPGPINKVVGSGIELPAAGPILGAAGPSPRWNIDFGSDTIRIDFIQQVATYGMGSYFTFSSLDPQLAGCPPAFISGITVTTNKPTVPFNVVAAATFGPHTVTIPIAGTANLDWKPGEFILVKLTFACDHNITPTPTRTFTPTPAPGTGTVVIDPCCPPWNKDLLKDMMFYHGSAGISAPYTLYFTPTNAFKLQMQAYINYLNLLPPFPGAMIIDWSLIDEGTNACGNSLSPSVSSATTKWTAPGVSTYASVPSPFFPNFPMLVGHWYRIHTVIHLDHGHFFDEKTCAINDICVRIQVMGARGSRPVLEFSDGQKVIKTVPIQ